MTNKKTLNLKKEPHNVALFLSFPKRRGEKQQNGKKFQTTDEHKKRKNPLASGRNSGISVCRTKIAKCRTKV